MLELNAKPKPEVAGREEVKVDPVVDEPKVDEPMGKEDEEECEEVAEEACHRRSGKVPAVWS